MLAERPKLDPATLRAVAGIARKDARWCRGLETTSRQHGDVTNAVHWGARAHGLESLARGLLNRATREEKRHARAR